MARLEFPRETGLILRCAGKAGNPFQTTQGNRLSCRDQEGRPYGPLPARVICPSDSLGMNSGVGCHALLQGILPTQGLNSYLLPALHWHPFGPRSQASLQKAQGPGLCFATPWTIAHQASLSLTVSQSLPKFMSIESARLGAELELRRSGSSLGAPNPSQHQGPFQ